MLLDLFFFVGISPSLDSLSLLLLFLRNSCNEAGRFSVLCFSNLNIEIAKIIVEFPKLHPWSLDTPNYPGLFQSSIISYSFVDLLEGMVGILHGNGHFAARNSSFLRFVTSD